MHNENWDDLRFVLAVVDTGSLLRAARLLGVNHATVLRRVAAFEQRHETVLFERTAQGYRLLADRAHIIRAAQVAEAAIDEVHRLASGGQQTLRGTVRLTSTDTLCAMVLPYFVATLISEERGLVVSLLSSNAYLDLLREQNTIALRPTVRLGDDMVGVVAADLGFAAYAADRDHDEWLTLSGPLSRSVAAQWIGGNISSARQTTAADSFLTLRELAASGQGIAVLPCFIGEADTRLKRIDDKMPHLTVPLWVARHADSVESPQMRALQTRLVGYLSDQSSLLSYGARRA